MSETKRQVLAKCHRNLACRLRGLMARALWVSSCCVLVGSMTGCGATSFGGARPIDGMFLGYRDHVWANRAYNLSNRGYSRPLMSHHRKGFVAGYCDVCQGGDGYIPALPPEEYWSYEYQSSQGSDCVKAWFDGYPEGVAAARRLGAHRYREVFVSDEVNAAIAVEQHGRFLPSDVSVVKPDSATSAKSGVPTTPAKTITGPATNSGTSILPRIELPWAAIPSDSNN
ncbi:MAG TPA: hypothetical protein PKD54_05240 [Pirellulaceae bacterium]|nr:hypothetical protein [Pirellulaceae bacterium]